ncbi:OmpA family protein [Sungkyunkwania multivorans]|uniref:OmpA family protein n=1 Tax=Sungkyunkwania multivorans TaxID=1173618 RepID=A0ABW3CXQ4_9FLAO
MKQFFLGFLLFLAWSIFGIWFYSCKIKAICDRPEPIPEPKEIAVVPKVSFEDRLRLRSGDDFSLSDLRKVILVKDSTIVRLRDADSTLRLRIFNYLNNNQMKELSLTGYYRNDENPRFGLLRAENFKEKLISFGVNGDKLYSSSDTLSFSFNSSGLFSGGIGMNFQDIPEERLAKIEAGIANKILYAGFGSKTFKPDNTIQAYAKELRAYLNKYPEKMVTVTGHTDSVGEEINNHWFGMQRAKNVRDYLISQGIESARLKADSKGELSPIATNATKEGRSLNRRIEITIN